MSNGEEEARRRKIIADGGVIQMAAECIVGATRGEYTSDQLEAMAELDREWMKQTRRVMGGKAEG